MYASMPGSFKDTIIYQKYIAKIKQMIDPYQVMDNRMGLEQFLP